MATFKVGQRVRIVGKAPAWAMLIGQEGVIVRPGKAWDWIVAGPDVPFSVLRTLPRGQVGCDSHELAPLTDPGADAFMERIKKLKPYDEPKADVQRRFIDKIESVVGPLGPRFK